MKQEQTKINLRVTENEKIKLQRNARKCNLSLSAYLRKVGLNKEIYSVPDKEFYKIYLALSNLKNELTNYTTIDEIKSKLEQIKIQFLEIYNSKPSGENENGND